MEILNQKKNKVTTRVDLTAMVDLGFLLITFFMLAMTFNQPKILEVNKPTDEGTTNSIPESKTSIIMLGAGDKLYTYQSAQEIRNSDLLIVDSMDYNPGGLRKYLQRCQDEVQAQWGDKDQLFVMIKPLPGSSYKNLIDVMDEMMINKVKRYAIINPTEKIDSLIASKVGQSVEK